MRISEYLALLKNQPEQLQFSDLMTLIETYYNFTPTSFKNGTLKNAIGQNSGSCKLFSFAKLHNLSPEETLQCFGAYYRLDVIKNPEGTDHQNIRNFISTGWDGIVFSSEALQAK